MTLLTDPPGLSVVAGINAQAGATPLTITGIECGTISITAVSPRILGGKEYGFSSRSDGGARGHDVTMFKADRTVGFVGASECGGEGVFG